eukprot:Gregarina_sp_Poly_1__7770@NODE_43_length_18077_cov_117_559078_g37_i0_p2_GENE_NODE_43_length_18077_cov_117_559078_g37_i0NODE_43_length_18077_cov_117_559078_g37_i0_p2_ORF_typecomplete_len666_score108_39BSD/PF03909_17/32BSD/PF03909_17/0_014_NODE_43_length_18077_cov_117_559078_g37_i027494746
MPRIHHILLAFVLPCQKNHLRGREIALRAMEDEDVLLWRVGIKSSTSSKEALVSGLISISAEDGCIDFASDEGTEITWPLEAFIRHRKNPKQPMVQLQFQQDLTELERKFGREREIGAFSKELVVSFVCLGEKATSAVEEFLNKVLSIRKAWLQQPPESAAQTTTLEKAAREYEVLVSKIESKKQQQETHALSSRFEQFRVAKSNALQIHSDLALLYQDLVINRKIISEDEFWNKHAEALAGSLPLPSPEEGFFFPSSSMVVEDSKGNVAEMNIKQFSVLLSESEVISRKHTELVETGKLNEQEFWSRLFKSRFYARLTGNALHAVQKDTYFDECDNEEPHQIQEAGSIALETIVSDLIAPDINVANMDHISKEGFGVRQNGDIVATGPKPPPLAVYAERKMAKKTEFTLFERFNRHASRALKSRKEMTALFSSGTQQVHAVDSSVENLGVLAALLSLEKTLGNDKLHVESSIAKNKELALQESVILQDLTTDKTETKPCQVQAARRLLRIPLTHAFDGAAFMAALSAEAQGFSMEIDPASHDALAKCCFVKYTNSLKGLHDHENEEFLQEVSTSPKLVDLFHRVADLQSRVKEILFYVYNQRSASSLTSALLALNDIKLELNEIKQLEIEVSASSRLTTVLNTRTLCQPLLHAIDCAIAACPMN